MHRIKLAYTVSEFPEIKRITFGDLRQDQNNNIILKSCQIISLVEITEQQMLEI